MARSHWALALASAIEDDKMRVDGDTKTVTIKDGYPKARHHYLVIPKPVQSRGVASLEKGDCELVRHMLKRGEDLAERLQAKDSSLKFRFGFHAVPSMVHLHLHVVSQDFDSPSLKNKKHWNSFTTDFFLDAEEIISKLQSEGSIKIDKRHYEDLLKNDLACPRCKVVCSNLPRMKDHYGRCKGKDDR